jgi:hypothetical protein
MQRKLLITGIAVALAVIGAVVAFQGGGLVEPFPPLVGVTELRIRNRAGDSISVIQDTMRIKQVVAYVNARNAGWTRPIGGIPIPRVVIEFHGVAFMGHVGFGNGFLETQRMGTFASRRASETELATIRALLGVYGAATCQLLSFRLL